MWVDSSIFSEFSDHWRDEKRYKVALGQSYNMSEVGDDIGSISGSCLDQWEWDDECNYEGDFNVKTLMSRKTNMRRS